MFDEDEAPGPGFDASSNDGVRDLPCVISENEKTLPPWHAAEFNMDAFLQGEFLEMVDQKRKEDAQNRAGIVRNDLQKKNDFKQLLGIEEALKLYTIESMQKQIDIRERLKIYKDKNHYLDQIKQLKERMECIPLL